MVPVRGDGRRHGAVAISCSSDEAPVAFTGEVPDPRTPPESTTTTTTTSPTTTSTTEPEETTPPMAEPGIGDELSGVATVEFPPSATLTPPVWIVERSEDSRLPRRAVGGEATVSPDGSVAWSITAPARLGLVTGDFSVLEFTPIQAGPYVVALSPTGYDQLLAEMVVTEDGPPVRFEPVETLPPDPELAILEPDGLAGVRFSTSTPVAVEELARRLGPPDDDSGWMDGCPVFRIVRWGGLQAEFRLADEPGRTDEVPPDAGELAVYYFDAWDRAGEGEPILDTRAGWTTPAGIRLGSPVAELLSTDPPFEFRTGYDSLTAETWLGEGGLSARLTGNVTDTGAKVVSIGAPGWAPHLTVC